MTTKKLFTDTGKCTCILQHSPVHRSTAGDCDEQVSPCTLYQ